MGKFIIKIADDNQNNYYLEWSTIVDAPTTYGMPLDEFKEYYLNVYGINAAEELNERLSRVESNGVSGHHPYDDLNDLLSHNRAGENETHLDKEGLLEKYCRHIDAQ
jgi:hypothetical protein